MHIRCLLASGVHFGRPRSCCEKHGDAFRTSVVNEEGNSGNTVKPFRARGLLYCASMNTAINDHIAQFVKGAHMLTAAAVVALLMAAIPTSIMFLRTPASPVETQNSRIRERLFIGVIYTSRRCRESQERHPEVVKRQVSEDDVKLLEAKVAKLDAKLSALQKALQVNPPRKVLPPPMHGSSDH